MGEASAHDTWNPAEMTNPPVEPDFKPCPFCGGTAAREDITDGVMEGGSVISCLQCGASSPVHFDRKENLESSWNDRKPSYLGKIADEARRYAGFYPQSSDSRNTFTMFAEWVDSLSDQNTY